MGMLSPLSMHCFILSGHVQPDYYNYAHLAERKKCPEEPPLSMSVYVDSEKSVFSQLLNKLGVGARACFTRDIHKYRHT